RLQNLSKNTSGFYLSAHPVVGNGKATTRKMRRILCFTVECNRLRKIALLAIGGGKIRIEVKVIRIELKCPLALINCLVNLIVGEIGGGGDIANDGRYGI